MYFRKAHLCILGVDGYETTWRQIINKKLLTLLSFFDYNFHVCIMSDSIFLWRQRKDAEGL